jgi:hypothetical protein
VCGQVPADADIGEATHHTITMRYVTNRSTEWEPQQSKPCNVQAGASTPSVARAYRHRGCCSHHCPLDGVNRDALDRLVNSVSALLAIRALVHSARSYGHLCACSNVVDRPFRSTSNPEPAPHTQRHVTRCTQNQLHHSVRRLLQTVGCHSINVLAVRCSLSDGIR